MSEKKKEKSGADKRFSKEAEPERAKTRQKYKELSQRLENLDVRETRVEESYAVINQVIADSNIEIEKIHVTPREMRMDASVVMNTTKKYSDILDMLVAGGPGQKFEVEEFASKLSNRMSENSRNFGRDEGHGVSRDDWVTFASTASKAFKSPMTLDGRPLYFQCLTIGIEGSGPPAPANVSPSPRRRSQVVAAPKRQQQLQKQAPPPVATRLKEIKPSQDNEGTDKNMQRRMEVCREVIRQAIRNSGNHPIHYLELVTDPGSYENTVRNMFTVSFLLNRSEVGMVFDGDDQPYLYIIKDKHKLRDREDHPKLKVKEDLEDDHVGNWIISITPDEWREIIELYSIQEAMLPAPETTD